MRRSVGPCKVVGWLVFRAASLNEDADFLPLVQSGVWPNGWEYENITFDYTITSFSQLRSTFNNTSFPHSSFWNEESAEGYLHLPFSYGHKDLANAIVYHSTFKKPDSEISYDNPLVTLSNQLNTESAWAEIPRLQIGWVQINGTFEIGETVTASLTGSPNVRDINYQWFRNGNPILGADKEVYLITPLDSGHTISAQSEYTSSSTGKRTTSSSFEVSIVNTEPTGSHQGTVKIAFRHTAMAVFCLHE